MKKLILTLFVLALCVSAKAAITPVATGVDCRYLEFAMDVDSEGNAVLHYASFEYNDDMATIKIYNEELQTICEFTVKAEIVNRTQFDYWSDVDIIAARNFYLKDDKWYAIVDQGNGYVLVDEQGNIVDAPFQGEYYIILSDMFKGKPYAVVYHYVSQPNGSKLEYRKIYTFDDSASISAVEVATATAYPNPLRRGQDLNMTLARPSDENTIITITDMHGRQIIRRRVERDTDKITLHDGHINHGQYIYTIIYGDGEMVSGKILAE